MKRILALETLKKIGEKVKLAGWIAGRRNHGKIAFLDLRDRSGIIQAVIDAQHLKRFLAGDMKPESVVEIEGIVRERPKTMVNSKIPTGHLEVAVENLSLLGESRDLPFPLDVSGYDIEEEVRLKYRYLDLRRERLTRNIRLRSRLVQSIREFFLTRDFTEIETPLLSKSTPEGSRDFLVPSRLQPGKFYALPQSPQQYKQLLMIAGFERYFQIARCLRDEDLRADRGFEHTQVDVEMSFVTRREVMAILEEMIIDVFEKLGKKIGQKPFPVFSYQKAMEKFKSDKFDMRTDKEKEQGILAFAWVVDFPFFEKDKEGNWTFTHNPFSAPKEEFVEDLLAKKNIENILTSQYDLVCNGFELGGGSIRSHKSELLSAVFEVMGYPKAKIRQQFGHILDAFSYGAPPHGGCAFGVDRVTMIATGEDSLREVVAFPQTARGRTAVMDAPNPVDDAQLRELGISVIKPPATGTVFEKIKSFLDSYHLKYQIFKHQAVYNSEEAAKVRNTDLHQGAKALVLYGDKKPLMVVLPADTKIDFKEFKFLYTVKDLRMATAEEVKRLTNVEIGAVPPLGNLFQLPLYVDEKLFDNKIIVYNAGLHTVSIEMSAEDYRKVTDPTIGSFSA